MVPAVVRSNSGRVLTGSFLWRINLLGTGRRRSQNSNPIKPNSRDLMSTSPNHKTTSFPFHRLRHNPIFHRHHGGWRRLNLPLRRQKPHRRILPHRRDRVLLHVGHHVHIATSLQFRIKPNGSRGRQIIQHELQPIQHPSVRHVAQQLVENPSSNETVFTVSKLSGKSREITVNRCGRKKQTKHPKELKDLGAPKLWNHVD